MINIVPRVATKVGIFITITRNAFTAPMPIPTVIPKVSAAAVPAPAISRPAVRLQVSCTSAPAPISNPPPINTAVSPSAIIVSTLPCFNIVIIFVISKKRGARKPNRHNMITIPTPVPLPSSSVPTFAGRSLFLSNTLYLLSAVIFISSGRPV